MLELRVELPGGEPLAIALQRFGEQIEDFSDFWQDWLLPIWFQYETQNYETQGRATGDAWAPLTAAYDTWKQKHWPGLPIGVLSGATRESLTIPGDSNGVTEMDSKTLTVGTRVPWAIFQQMGTGRRGAGSGRRPYKNYTHGPSVGMPARPPLRLGQDFIVAAGHQLHQYAVKSLNETVTKRETA